MSYAQLQYAKVASDQTIEAIVDFYLTFKTWCESKNLTPGVESFRSFLLSEYRRLELNSSVNAHVDIADFISSALMERRVFHNDSK